MSRLRRGASVLWALVLVAATVLVVVGSSPDRARAAAPACLLGCVTTTSSSSSTSTTSSSTSTTTTTPPPPSTAPSSYAAAFVPCGTSSGPCNREPQQIQITYQAGPAAAVEVDWLAQGRAAGAPKPDSEAVNLKWADGYSCGNGVRCWTWPAGMTASSFVLNGAYQVVTCGTDTGGTCGSPLSTQDIKVAAPPGPPTQVRARASGNQVAVSWQPPTAAPPDLVGYTLARNGTAVYSCSTDGLGPGASVPCPSSLTVADRPGNGRYTYAVTAVRLGADTASKDVLSSAAVTAAGGAVAVPGPVSTPVPGGGGAGTVAGGTGTTAGAGSIGGFTPSPIIGSVGIVGSTVGLASGAAAGQALPGAAAPDLRAPGSPQNLRYTSDDPVVGQAAPLSLKVRNASGRSDVVPVAVLALGLLLLAIAAHFLYLRVELSAVQGRLAAARKRPD